MVAETTGEVRGPCKKPEVPNRGPRSESRLLRPGGTAMAARICRRERCNQSQEDRRGQALPQAQRSLQTDMLRQQR